MMPTSDYMEGTDSCNESMEVFIEAERQDHNNIYKRRSRRKKHVRPIIDAVSIREAEAIGKKRFEDERVHISPPGFSINSRNEKSSEFHN